MTAAFRMPLPAPAGPRPISFVAFCARLGVQLTPAQRVLCLVAFDDVDPIELETDDERALARQLFGDVRRFPPSARRTLCFVMGRGAGKSRMSGLWLLWRALTTDVSRLARGQRAYALVVAPTIKLGREVIRYARGAVEDGGGRIVLGDTDGEDGFTVKRKSGHEVAVECLAASAGGRATRGRSFVAAVLDETAFFRGEDYAISDEELLSAITPRLDLPGSRVLVASTPWAREGLLWKLFDRNYAHPKDALVARAPTTTMRPDADTHERAVAERIRDPDKAKREVDAEFLDVGTSRYFDAGSLDKAASFGLALGTKPPAGAIVMAGGDTGFTSDSCALVIVYRWQGVYYVLDVLEHRPEDGKPLKPSEVMRDWGVRCRMHGAWSVMADAHYQEALREHLLAADITLLAAPGGQQGKAETYAKARALLHEGRVRLPADARLLGQLREVTYKLTSGGGLSISSPRGPAGHGDIVSALVLALWQASGAEVVEPPPAPGDAGYAAHVARDLEEKRDRFLQRQADSGPLGFGDRVDSDDFDF